MSAVEMSDPNPASNGHLYTSTNGDVAPPGGVNDKTDGAYVTVVDDDEDESCFRENADNCCGENVRACRDCGLCLADCGKSSYRGCKGLECKAFCQESFSKENAKKKLPILGWLPSYRLNHLLGDLIGGLTVGLTVLPQSIAFASIAELPAQYGVYTAFICCYVYIFLGTAKDVNLGPAAVLSLLVGQFASSPFPGDASYAILLSLFCGLIQFVMGVLHLGFIADYISHPVLESFTTAAVVTIAFGQVKNWLGLKGVPREFIKQVYWTFKKIPETRIADFLLGLVCLIVLFILKKMKTASCMKPVAVPSKMSILTKVFRYIIWLLGTARNATVVILASIVAAVLYKNGNEDIFSLTGDIPPGIPPFRLPAFEVSNGNETYYFSDMFQSIGMGFVIIPLISFVETVAVAKNFAQKNKYKVDIDQELIALGVSNVFGSFVSAYPITATFSGSAVNFQSGVKTTAGGFYAATLILIVLAFITPAFYFIPNATLAVVIIMAVMDMADFGLIVHLWNVKKVELVAWFVTFILGLALGIENGLIIGTVVALAILIYPSSKPKIQTITPGTRQLTHLSTEDKQTPTQEYVVLTIGHGLVFPSVEFFKDHIISHILKDGGYIYKCVIVDFSHINEIDFTIVIGLGQLIEDLRTGHVSMVVCRIRPRVLKILKSGNIRYFKYATTIEEAVSLATYIRRTSLASSLEVDVSKEKGIFTTDLEGDQTTSTGYDLPSNNLHANLKNIEDHTSNNNFNYILPPNDSDSDSGMDNLAYKL